MGLLGKIIIIVGLLGILKNKNNNILMLLSLELFFIGISILFLNSSLILDDFDGIITSIIVLCLTATESAIGLTIILASLHHRSLLK